MPVAIREFSPPFDFAVFDRDLSGHGRLQLRQAGHFIAGNVCRTGKIALLELRLNVPQMLAHKRNLARIGVILGNNALCSAIGRFSENVDRRFEAEWHHVLAAFGDVGLALGIGGVGYWSPPLLLHLDQRAF